MLYDTTSLIFLSTLSLRRATVNGGVLSSSFGNFYPRSPCGERRRGGDSCYLDNIISIHALLAESDLAARDESIMFVFLSTLSLRRATITTTIICIVLRFLSTLSLRRATCYSFRHPAQGWYFYPRSPCGERRPPVREIIQWEGIFLSTLSLRRATRCKLGRNNREIISIHALLAESDRKYHTADRVRAYISIHALLAESDRKQSSHHKSNQ